MSVCVLLPTLNEVDSIGEMIDRVRKVDREFKIYVVDSGSTDGTVEEAEKRGVSLIKLKEKGKGRAIRKAFQEIDEDIAVLLDSDTSYAPEEIKKLLSRIPDYDVVLGSRFRGEIRRGSMKTINKLGNRLLTLWANILYGKKISDVCSGFWVFSRKAYREMEIDARHFSLEANFYAECAKRGFSLFEVPITYGVRRGETKLNIFHGFEIGWYLFQKRFF